jgi:hypothetical protein
MIAYWINLYLFLQLSSVKMSLFLNAAGKYGFNFDLWKCLDVPIAIGIVPHSLSPPPRNNGRNSKDELPSSFY